MSTHHSPTTPCSSVSSCGTVKTFSSLRDLTQKNSDQVPSTVQNLLISTQRLQDVLRLWSVGQASEGDVSDMYVQIGNNLNLTISAFAQHQIDLRYVRRDRIKICRVAHIAILLLFLFSEMVSFFFFFGYSDVNSIPGDLRVVLERCLSEDPSPDVLDTFMPEVRHVLSNLLRGLKNQQANWQTASRRRP